MGIIKWLGESENWKVPECEGHAHFVMPLVERWVLDVANLEGSVRKLALQAGLNCTSRLALRTALASTDLNPRWSPWEWHGSSVIKAPASAANLGVRFLETNEYIKYLEVLAPDLARFGIIEAFVDGPQYEVDGYVLGGDISCFCCLFQHWNSAFDRILAYERKEPPFAGWREAVVTAVKRVGIDDCPFCVEMRYDLRLNQWKVIEIHARLGEDPGLPELMSDDYPLMVIEQACLSHIR